MMRNKSTNRERGQGMVEFIVVLVFGVMVMTIGPGGDVLLDLLGVMNDKYQGYSYAASLSDLPQYDSLGAYTINATGVDPQALANQLNSYTTFPSLSTFPSHLMPTSPADILDGATSFF